MRTTITISESLVQQVDKLISQGEIKTRNQFIVEALEDKVRQIRDLQLDEKFVGMADDMEYQQEALEIEQKFTSSDYEVIKITE